MKTNEYEMAWQTLKTVLQYSHELVGETQTPKLFELIEKIEKQFGIQEQTEQQK